MTHLVPFVVTVLSTYILAVFIQGFRHCRVVYSISDGTADKAPGLFPVMPRRADADHDR